MKLIFKDAINNSSAKPADVLFIFLLGLGPLLVRMLTYFGIRSGPTASLLAVTMLWLIAYGSELYKSKGKVRSRLLWKAAALAIFTFLLQFAIERLWEI